jgi:hypothetical protein
MFYTALIAPFAPYSLGGILWDQAERDVHCFAPATNKIAEYPAWQRALAESWRAAFKSPAAVFAAIFTEIFTAVYSQTLGAFSFFWGPEKCDKRLSLSLFLQEDNRKRPVITLRNQHECSYMGKLPPCDDRHDAVHGSPPWQSRRRRSSLVH